MTAYGPGSYGDAMADVYDDWYGSSDDTGAAVARLAGLATGGPVLELGAGTGRLALPLAAQGLAVAALDASAAMLDRLRAKPGAERVEAVLGDMADPGTWPPGPFSLVVVAVNTLFNLTTAAAQAACVAGAAAHLAPGGRLVVEAFVPPEAGAELAGPSLTVRSVGPDQVVLSASTTDLAGQTVLGQFVELRDGQPVRLRPWQVRWATVAQLDAMAAAAGLELESREGGWRGEPFGPDAPHHVSVYRRPVGHGPSGPTNMG